MIETDIVIKRRLNYIDVSLYTFEYRALKDPNMAITRGLKPQTQQRWTNQDVNNLRTVHFLKGYSEEMLSRMLHSNVTIHLHVVAPREHIFMALKQNNGAKPVFRQQ